MIIVKATSGHFLVGGLGAAQVFLSFVETCGGTGCGGTGCGGTGCGGTGCGGTGCGGTRSSLVY